MAQLRTAFRFGAAMAVLLVAVSAASVFVRQAELRDAPRRAVIYDPLHATQTRVNFTGRLESLLVGEGFAVDVYEGEEADVDRIRGLSARYSLVVFRVHSGVFEDDVWLFTGEEFESSRHVMMQLAGEVHIARSPNDPRVFFSVGPRFLEHHLAGRFSGCLVVLMGCEAMGDLDLAEAFRGAGASSVVGWEGPVSLTCSDEAVLELIRRLLGGESLGYAVGSCMSEDGVALLVYPVDAESFSLR